MVMSFRVSELQVLLGFAGRNKSGRKHELLAKALHLLKSSCAPSVQMKIKELYRRRFPRKSLGPSDFPLLSLPPGTSPVGSPGSLAPIPPSLLTPGTLLGPKREVDLHPPLPQPVHPDVTMKPLPFYEVYGELIRPTTLGKAGCGPSESLSGLWFQLLLFLPTKVLILWAQTSGMGAGGFSGLGLGVTVPLCPQRPPPARGLRKHTLPLRSPRSRCSRSSRPGTSLGTVPWPLPFFSVLLYLSFFCLSSVCALDIFLSVHVHPLN